jgi:hypothetical protein
MSLHLEAEMSLVDLETARSAVMQSSLTNSEVETLLAVLDTAAKEGTLDSWCMSKDWEPASIVCFVYYMAYGRWGMQRRGHEDQHRPAEPRTMCSLPAKCSCSCRCTLHS